MKDHIDNTQNQAVIELGAASVETQGIPVAGNETMGYDPEPGISNE